MNGHRESLHLLRQILPYGVGTLIVVTDVNNPPSWRLRRGSADGPVDCEGIPHVTGVRTTEGEEVSADLVVDAMGRRSKLPNWLEAIGARRPIEEAEDSGFIYYTRFFRSTTGLVPPYRAGLLTYFQSFRSSRSPATRAPGR